jgi:hypothetical protein
MSRVPAPDDEALRRLAAEILAREEYSDARRALEAWEALLERLRWLDSILGWGDLAASDPLLYYAILGTLLVVAAALTAHIAWTVRAALTAPAPPAATTAPAPAPRFTEEADALARQGHYLEAAHRLQLGILDLLLRGRRLELSRSEPNRILRRRLAEARLDEGERRDLVELLDRFETRWFRDREDDPALYRGWRALYQRLVRGDASA